MHQHFPKIIEDSGWEITLSSPGGKAGYLDSLSGKTVSIDGRIFFDDFLEVIDLKKYGLSDAELLWQWSNGKER
jgi:hypothetical protein